MYVIYTYIISVQKTKSTAFKGRDPVITKIVIDKKNYRTSKYI